MVTANERKPRNLGRNPANIVAIHGSRQAVASARNAPSVGSGRTGNPNGMGIADRPPPPLDFLARPKTPPDGAASTSRLRRRFDDNCVGLRDDHIMSVTINR